MKRLWKRLTRRKVQTVDEYCSQVDMICERYDQSLKRLLEKC
ncbi:hypothetical protein BSP15_243 [Bacillus phage BSP15]|nr:hypothetical protein IM043_gp163 [Bacillus phage SPG24]AYJ74260.1 hypothetical protein BSP15_243 [Bacillus phage BSP15]